MIRIRHLRLSAAAVACAVALPAAFAAEAAAQSRRATLAVRLTVVRSCAIDTGAAAGANGLAVTCSRGATPSVVSGPAAAPIPAVTERSLVEVPAPRATGSSSLAAPVPDGFEPVEDALDASRTFELVTINF